MIGRMVKKAVIGAVSTWALRQGRQWWDEREGKQTTSRRTTSTRTR